MDLPIEFFKVEQNKLNNEYMVHSDCNQLVQCFHFPRKSEANKAKDDLNKQANSDYQKLKVLKMAPVLTWKKPVKS